MNPPPHTRSTTKRKTQSKKQISPSSKQTKKEWNMNIISHRIIKTIEDSLDRNLFHYFTEEGMENYSGKEILDFIKKSAHALKALGVKQGNHVGIMTKSSPQWICFEQAIYSIGAISVGLFEKSSFEYLEVQLTETKAKIVFVDSDESSEKLTAFQKDLKIVVLKDSLYAKVKANKNFTIPRILSWSQFLKLGTLPEPKFTKDFKKHLFALKEDQVISTIYTTSTREQPKGAIFTHQHFSFQLNSLEKIFLTDPQTDRGISVLPLSHVLERLTTYYTIVSRTPVCFIEKPQRSSEAIKLFRPTVMAVVPQLLERIYEKIHERTPKVFLIKQLYKSALKYAEEREPLTQPTWKYRLFKWLFYNTFYQALGGNLRFIVSSGAALRHPLLRFFYSINVPIYEGYGLTETCATVSCNYKATMKPYSVGKIMPGIKTKISSEGELFVQSPSLMKGYLKNPEHTKEVLKKDAQGKIWFATGDKVKIKNGFVLLEGRIKDFFKVPSGHFLHPLQIEKMLERHHLIKNAVILGENRPAVCALIFIDVLNIKKTPSDLNHFEKIMKSQIQDWIQTLNAKLNSWERIKNFKVIWRALSLSENEITFKSEVRRLKIQKKFKKEIEEMYRSLERDV